jgi:hypothetical protein
LRCNYAGVKLGLQIHRAGDLICGVFVSKKQKSRRFVLGLRYLATAKILNNDWIFGSDPKNLQ